VLTQSEIVPYLLAHRLVSAESIVEGDLVVMDASRRNRNYKVISERGPSYLLKQGIGPEGRATLANEMAVYQLIQSDRSAHELERFLPHYYGYDPEEHILILELVRNGKDLREYHADRGRFSTAIARMLADALGLLHRLTKVQAKLGEVGQRFSGHPPWVLSIHRTGFSLFQRISNANIQLIRIVQQFPEFCEYLDTLRQGWIAGTLIHQDLKWDNCIVFAKPGSQRKTGLKIVDWELASMGDPCWDAASVFSNYLSFWLLSIPLTGETPSEQFIELARYPLVRMHSAIRTFWQSYVRQMGLNTTIANEWLLRAVQYGAARLVQTAFEQMQMSVRLMSNTVCLLQLSLNILRRPQEALVNLLGLSLE
jgi:thiamine kinase-like enzyme